MEIFSYAITALASYLLGSIPTGYLVAKAKGIDIRNVGSGNIGATNVFRILGKGAGIFVLLVDALKGFAAVWLAAKIFPALNVPTEVLETHKIVAGIFAILGHNYTCWLRFKGGKGIATTAGVLLALAPVAFLIALAIFLMVVFLTRYISLGAIVAAFCLPFAVWISGGSKTMIIVMAALGALAIYKHKANIKRMMNGTENRFGKKKNIEP